MLWRRLSISAVLCALPFALIACGHESPPDPRTQSPQVRVATVQEAGASSRTFTGTVAARVQSDLGFRVPGKVLERLVDTGQAVKRGQVLMRIDPADLRLAVHAQQEAVAAARARALQTEGDEARYRDLRGTGAISATAYDQAKAAADAAKAQLSAAEAQADLALNARRYAELVADSDGVVVETLAEPGQVVTAAQVVVRMARGGPREAVVQLPETVRPAVGSAGQATLFGKEGVVVPTTLRQLSDAADRLTRTFEARYVLRGELANAPLGATVTVRILDAASAAPGDLLVPIGALIDMGKGPGVWVIRGAPAKVYWQPVVVGHLTDSGARITGKLQQGEQIVALGAHLLHEGDQVTVADRADAAAAGVRP
ncbi:efflux RND transporter periplasmic adaptor subunit [Acidovorax sp. ACV01]|uniref:efflux RND transporter periplasmic adaptor subunit n=1 Tax=Acidovorax sp. ACV01 TaxID=2769311 RepID=UPI00177D1886|nr:efflux RND transporter periplasmic adaptor subunit [Acidovorax sp. ACV01]MBD9391390.1 efflux RND transporter periplasmic adaptor subunit [Acidovorax sp. ACV01]